MNAMAPGDLPACDAAAAVEFLQRWCPTGPWIVVSFAAEGGACEALTFGPETEARGRAWLNARIGRRNLYFKVNQLSRPMMGAEHGKKTDVRAVVALHVDIDPRPREDITEERKRALSVLRAYNPPPTVIVDSGGGYQGFWKLSEAQIINGDEARAEDLERFNREIEIKLGGDNCHDVSRVMRLPGTVNLPTPKKIKKGRVPALASVVEFHEDRVYALSVFVQAPPPRGAVNGDGRSSSGVYNGVAEKTASPAPREALSTVNLDDLPETVRQRVKMLAVQGRDPDDEQRYPSESEVVWVVCCELVRANMLDETIVAILLDKDLGVSRHIYRQPKPIEYAWRQVNRARLAARDPEIAKLNETYAVVDAGNQTAILVEGVDHKNRPVFKFWTPSSFQLWLANRTVRYEVTEKDKKGNPVKKTVETPVAKYWIAHPQRRQYKGVVFAPGRDLPDHYNLFKGWAVAPRSGDCSRFLAHVKDNVCKGDDDLFRWVMGWWAQIFQRPESKVGTSLVVRGKQGAGKTKVGDVMKSLLGDHYTAVSDPRYITGQFNSHLVSCLLLHAEEAFWAGDHAGEGKLKDLVTSNEHHIEFKGKEPVRMDNFVRLFVTGNPDWVVPVAMEDRRFAVLDIGEDHLKDFPYFAAIDAEMDAGGREALLDHLLGLDLSGINLREVPKTDALLRQKVLSLSPEEKWWLDTLNRGQLPNPHGEPDECPVEVLFDDYIEHAKKTSAARSRSIEIILGNFLHKKVPGLNRQRVTCRFFDKREQRVRSDKVYRYKFPSLAACRAAFDKALGQKFTWEDGDEWSGGGETGPF